MVDLSSWSEYPTRPYHERALDSAYPHGIDCGCLMCSDMRLDAGLARLETLVGELARRHDERAAGLDLFPDPDV